MNNKNENADTPPKAPKMREVPHENINYFYLDNSWAQLGEFLKNVVILKEEGSAYDELFCSYPQIAEATGIDIKFIVGKSSKTESKKSKAAFEGESGELALSKCFNVKAASNLKKKAVPIEIMRDLLANYNYDLEKKDKEEDEEERKKQLEKKKRANETITRVLTRVVSLLKSDPDSLLLDPVKSDDENVHKHMQHRQQITTKRAKLEQAKKIEEIESPNFTYGMFKLLISSEEGRVSICSAVKSSIQVDHNLKDKIRDICIKAVNASLEEKDKNK